MMLWITSSKAAALNVLVTAVQRGTDLLRPLIQVRHAFVASCGTPGGKITRLSGIVRLTITGIKGYDVIKAISANNTIVWLNTVMFYPLTSHPSITLLLIIAFDNIKHIQT